MEWEEGIEYDGRDGQWDQSDDTPTPFADMPDIDFNTENMQHHGDGSNSNVEHVVAEHEPGWLQLRSKLVTHLQQARKKRIVSKNTKAKK